MKFVTAGAGRLQSSGSQVPCVVDSVTSCMRFVALRSLRTWIYHATWSHVSLYKYYQFYGAQCACYRYHTASHNDRGYRRHKKYVFSNGRNSLATDRLFIGRLTISPVCPLNSSPTRSSASAVSRAIGAFSSTILELRLHIYINKEDCRWQLLLLTLHVRIST